MRQLCFLMPAVLAACSSPGRQAAWEVQGGADPAGVAKTATQAAASLEAQADELWAKRDDKASLSSAIAAWEKSVEADASNAAALLRLSRAYYFMADGHISLEDGDTDQAQLAIYEKGVNAGERALILLEPEFEKAMRAGQDFALAITQVGPKGMPAAYWYCANLGRFANKKGLSARLYYKDKIRAAMERVRALDASFFYAAGDRYFGAFFAVLPSIAGKDLKKSEEHFNASIKLAPEYLPTRVLQAQFLAPDKGDEKMFEELLNGVLAAPDTDNPDIAPENRAAKRAAKKLLAQKSDLF